MCNAVMNKALEMHRNRYRFRCLPKKRCKKHVFGGIGSIGNGIGLHTSMNSPTMGGAIKEENAKNLTTPSYRTWPYIYIYIYISAGPLGPRGHVKTMATCISSDEQ